MTPGIELKINSDQETVGLQNFSSLKRHRGELIPIDYAIQELKLFRDAFSHLRPSDLILLDIDDTLMEPTTKFPSDIWFCHEIVQNQVLGMDRHKALQTALYLWEAGQHVTGVKTVEETTADHVKALQKNHPKRVMGLTTRGIALAERTIEQLGRLNINLALEATNSGEKHFMNPWGIIYKDGTLFTAGSHKGKALQQLLNHLEIRPERVVFINDKQKHLDQLGETCKEMGIRYLGFRYGFSDERVSQFSPAIGNLQSKSFSYIPSNKDALAKLGREECKGLPAISKAEKEDHSIKIAYFGKVVESTRLFVVGQISTIATLPEILEKGDLLVFDVEDTLFETTTAFPGKQWLDRQVKVYQEMGMSDSSALNKVLPLYSAGQLVAEVQPVEKDTVAVIKKLQKDAFKVIGVTPRGLSLADRTVGQLREIGLDLKASSLTSDELHFMNPRGILHRNGVLLTAGTHKGEALFKLLEHLKITPSRIVFVSHYSAEFKEFGQTCTERKVACLGLQYYFSGECRADPDFNYIAEEQAKIFGKIMSDESAAKIDAEEEENLTES